MEDKLLIWRLLREFQQDLYPSYSVRLERPANKIATKVCADLTNSLSVDRYRNATILYLEQILITVDEVIIQPDGITEIEHDSSIFFTYSRLWFRLKYEFAWNCKRLPNSTIPHFKYRVGTIFAYPIQLVATIMNQKEEKRLRNGLERIWIKPGIILKIVLRDLHLASLLDENEHWNSLMYVTRGVKGWSHSQNWHLYEVDQIVQRIPCNQMNEFSGTRHQLMWPF